jgi:hypothetical protein
MSTASLFDEAAELLIRARAAIELEETTQDNKDNRRTKMNYEDQSYQPQPQPKVLIVTSDTAGELYSSGKSVFEVAQACGITYGKARRLIRESGTPIRDASSRLKGRTRRPHTTS